MPVWGQVALGIAALLVAGGVIVRALRSAARLVATGDAVVAVFGDNPNALKVLYDIQAQFKTDSGSSLRDVINRLEEAANHNAAVMQGVIILLDRLDVKVVAGATTAQGVADNLAVAQQAVDRVAADLAKSHARADEVAHSEPPGTAADAASKQSVTDKQIEGDT